MSSNITPADLAGFREGYRADPMRQSMSRVLYTTDISKVICRPDDARKMVFKFSTDIKTMKSTNQKSSGRCWLFAATNVLREHIAKELNLESYRVVSNIGDQAGQSVRHLHFHVLSGRDMTWPPG